MVKALVLTNGAPIPKQTLKQTVNIIVHRRLQVLGCMQLMSYICTPEKHEIFHNTI